MLMAGTPRLGIEVDAAEVAGHRVAGWLTDLRRWDFALGTLASDLAPAVGGDGGRGRPNGHDGGDEEGFEELHGGCRGSLKQFGSWKSEKESIEEVQKVPTQIDEAL